MTNSNTLWSPAPKVLDLESHQVDVWRVFLSLPVATVKSIESHLSTEESQRADHFHFPADRDRYIAAHGCLRDILARYLRCEPSQLEFIVNGYGKPALNEHNLEFNLSHSGEIALVGVTRGRKVGVDVEHIRSDIEIESISSRFFSPNEVAELSTLPPEQRMMAFFNCWTRKEAYIKAHGLGLSLPLDSFDVSLTPNEPAVLRATRPDPTLAARWLFESLEVDPEYAAAVVVEDHNLEFRLWNWNTKDSIQPEQR